MTLDLDFHVLCLGGIDSGNVGILHTCNRLVELDGVSWDVLRLEHFKGPF